MELRGGFVDEKHKCFPIPLEHLTKGRINYAELRGDREIMLNDWEIEYGNTYDPEYMQIYVYTQALR